MNNVFMVNEITSGMRKSLLKSETSEALRL